MEEQKQGQEEAIPDLEVPEEDAEEVTGGISKSSPIDKVDP